MVICGYMWLCRVVCGYTGYTGISYRWLYVVLYELYRRLYAVTHTHTYTQSFSQDSMCKPTKLVSVVTRVKRDPDDPQAPAPPRPMSDGVVYGNFNERRIEYEEVLMSERTDSQFSQSESYISEGYAIRIVAMAVLLCMM